MIRKDKSETFALFLTSLILWFTGFADVLFFWLQGKAIPHTMPWLNNHIVIGKIRELIGLGVVTDAILLISVMSGFVMVIYLDIWLEKVN